MISFAANSTDRTLEIRGICKGKPDNIGGYLLT